ncbi:MAG: glycogen/starch synthase [Paraprevotella sp.]|nr:glycogen/starch synthase [Paraprevotella sp.]
MKAKKILFITQEMTPYVPHSELAAMGRELPQEIHGKGLEIRTFMPKWGNINERRNQLHEVIRLSGMNLIIDDTDHPLIIKVASIQAARMQVYFIDNDDYFLKRQMATDENGHEYEDNGERAIFYARGVLETVKKLRWIPDIIHCQGWMSSLVPLYVKTAYHEEPSFRDSKIVYSMSTSELTRPMGANFGNCIAFKEVDSSILQEFSTEVTFAELNKLAIDYSDGLTVPEGEKFKEIIDYARQKQIPVLENASATDSDAFIELYDQVWNKGKNE